MNIVLGKSLQLNSFVAKTDTPGLQGKDTAFFGRIAYRDPAWSVWLNYLDVGDNFNAEVGFVQRRGVFAIQSTGTSAFQANEEARLTSCAREAGVAKNSEPPIIGEATSRPMPNPQPRIPTRWSRSDLR